MCRHWAAATSGVQAMGFSRPGIGVFVVAALGFLGAGIGVFVVAALGFLSAGIGVFVVAALVFLWVAALGFTELSAPAPVFFFREKCTVLARQSSGNDFHMFY